MRRNLTKEERLSCESNVKKVFKSGQKVKTLGLSLFFIKNNLSFNRIAFSPARGFKGSVERNRVKRIFREIYRLSKYLISPGYDMVLIIYPGENGYREREKAFLYLCIKAGLINENYR